MIVSAFVIFVWLLLVVVAADIHGICERSAIFFLSVDKELEA